MFGLSCAVSPWTPPGFFIFFFMRWWSSFGSSICCYRLHAAYRRQCALLLFFGLMRSPCESIIYSLCAHLQPKIWDFLQSWPADSSCTGKVTLMLVLCSVFLDKQNNLCNLPVHKWYIYLHSQRAQVSSLPLHRSPDFLSNVALQPSVQLNNCVALISTLQLGIGREGTLNPLELFWRRGFGR